MGEAEIQRNVRQRDRFQCQYPNCGKAGEQYAHIVAEVDGGTYELNNLIYLCYEHHNYWQETARSPSAVKERLLAINTKLRDSEKTDSIISNALDWPARENLAITLGNGLGFANCSRILESLDPEHPYLTVGVDDFGLLRIDARFEGSNGNDFMHISNNRMEIHTASIWDIILKRRFFSVVNLEQDIHLTLRQDVDLTLRITGRLFLNGGFFRISDESVYDEGGRNTFENFRAISNSRGFMLSPGRFMI